MYLEVFMAFMSCVPFCFMSDPFGGHGTVSSAMSNLAVSIWLTTRWTMYGAVRWTTWWTMSNGVWWARDHADFLNGVGLVSLKVRSNASRRC